MAYEDIESSDSEEDDDEDVAAAPSLDALEFPVFGGDDDEDGIAEGEDEGDDVVDSHLRIVPIRKCGDGWWDLGRRRARRTTGVAVVALAAARKGAAIDAISAAHPRLSPHCVYEGRKSPVAAEGK